MDPVEHREPTMSTQRQIDANRKNAQKSTGPRTRAGKANSRLNAVTHGLTAALVPIPGEDPQVATDRLNAWQAELNPGASEVIGYFVAMSVFETIKLDRCRAVVAARTAKLARDAVGDRKEERLRVVEDCRLLFRTRPDAAVRRLKTSVEGIDHLLIEWDRLGVALESDTPAWCAHDGKQFARLAGLSDDPKVFLPDPTSACTLAMGEHRNAQIRLAHTEDSSDAYWPDRYQAGCDDHRLAIERAPVLAAEALRARDEVRGRIDREVDALRAIRAELAAADAIDIAEASVRMKFDVSDDGKWLRRYELDIQRGLIRAMEAIRKQKQMDLASTQADEAPPLPEEVGPGSSWDFGSQNEAKFHLLSRSPRGPIPLGDAIASDPIHDFRVGQVRKE